ncbi:hypothetical protein Btru_065320 [Bulinus truncatus]|nr:hypothetical protein Btru_065320 [Bulinus truncatus]
MVFPHILLQVYEKKLLDELSQKIRYLNGVFIESKILVKDATHFVCDELTCSELFLGACSKGFFPVKIVSKEHATSKIKWDTIEKEPVTYKKVVLMIIDALRSDFAFGIYNFFPKAQAIIKNGHGIGFTAVMQPPTVTLPRIKAIVTGDTPSFADVVHNFAATAVEEDSVLLQLRKEKRKIFFFGDDTWIKLFPGYFDKSDGTSSFFVSDFTEVDSNVSRHLSNELSFPEWDLMILHYLGLDHIGHVTGPHSPLIQPKLSEMDAVIDQIYSAMEKWRTSWDGSSQGQGVAMGSAVEQPAVIIS